MNINHNPYQLNLAKYSPHNIIKENLEQNELVLDLGCNDGYLGLISDKTNDFYGLDYSGESVNKAKTAYKAAIVYDLNILEKLPWDIKFDKIIMADVLEHLLFPEKVLNFFIGNYLKKEGRVIISLPNIANISVRLRLLSGNFDYTESGILDRTHLHLYTLKTARNFIESCGLEIIKEKFSSNRFGRLIAVFPFLSRILAYNLIFICQVCQEK